MASLLPSTCLAQDGAAGGVPKTAASGRQRPHETPITDGYIFRCTGGWGHLKHLLGARGAAVIAKWQERAGVCQGQQPQWERLPTPVPTPVPMAARQGPQESRGRQKQEISRQGLGPQHDVHSPLHAGCCTSSGPDSSVRQMLALGAGPARYAQLQGEGAWIWPPPAAFPRVSTRGFAHPACVRGG